MIEKMKRNVQFEPSTCFHIAHTHLHTHYPTHTYLHTHSPTHALSLSHTYTHLLAFLLVWGYENTFYKWLVAMLISIASSLCLSLSLSHSHTHAHTHTHTHAHTNAHTNAHTFKIHFISKEFNTLRILKKKDKGVLMFHFIFFTFA